MKAYPTKLLSDLNCPYCGREWKLNSARKANIRKHGSFQVLCRCKHKWVVKKNGEGKIFILLG